METLILGRVIGNFNIKELYGKNCVEIIKNMLAKTEYKYCNLKILNNLVFVYGCELSQVHSNYQLETILKQ